MQNNIFLLFACAIIIAIAGCASTGGWNTFSTPENPDFLYANGTAESKDLQLAIDKATMNARTEIARQLELKLNSLQKSFAEEVGTDDTELHQLYTSATKAVVSTQLQGSKVKDTKYREAKGKYNAVVLVEYPVAAANAALVDQIKKDENLYTRFRASEAFKELEAELEKLEKSKKEQ